MSGPIEKPVTAIIVPTTLVVLIAELSERMARVTGETADETRRAVELSVLSRGSAALQSEIAAMESQSERMGWPR